MSNRIPYEEMERRAMKAENSLAAVRYVLEESVRCEKEMRAAIKTLYDAIAHGDDAHRAWLKQKIEDHFA